MRQPVMQKYFENELMTSARADSFAVQPSVLAATRSARSSLKPIT